MKGLDPKGHGTKCWYKNNILLGGRDFTSGGTPQQGANSTRSARSIRAPCLFNGTYPRRWIQRPVLDLDANEYITQVQRKQICSGKLFCEPKPPPKDPVCCTPNYPAGHSSSLPRWLLSRGVFKRVNVALDQNMYLHSRYVSRGKMKHPAYPIDGMKGAGGVATNTWQEAVAKGLLPLMKHYF